MTPQSPSKQAPWDLTHLSQLPSAAPLYFPESQWQSEISSLSRVILVFGKARSHRAPNLGYSRAESPGQFDVSPKTLHETWCTSRRIVVMKLPMATAFQITRTVPMEECPSLTQNVMQIRCCTHWVILNVTPTQYTCSLNGVYRPHWLVQWSHHCSRMCIQSALLCCQVTCMVHKLFLLCL